MSCYVWERETARERETACVWERDREREREGDREIEGGRRRKILWCNDVYVLVCKRWGLAVTVLGV